MAEESIELTRLKRAIETKDVNGICEVWLLDWRALPRLDETALLPFLDASSLERYSGIFRTERRLQFLLGRLLLKLAISAKTGVSFDRITVHERPAHSPTVTADGWLFNDVYFSISHSKSHLAIAISTNRPVGIDIELAKVRRNYDEISRIAFLDEEQLWLDAQPENSKLDKFYLLWTRKESCYKIISDMNLPFFSGNFREINGLNSSFIRWKSWAHGQLIVSVCLL